MVPGLVGRAGSEMSKKGALVVDLGSNMCIETLPHYRFFCCWAVRHPYFICGRTEKEVEETPLCERTREKLGGAGRTSTHSCRDA